MDYNNEDINSTMELTRSLLPKNKLARIVTDEDGQTEFYCLLCSAKFLEKEKLELHLVMHNKEYRFLCGICGTGLKRKEHLDRHTLGHQEVRPHICPECGKGFKRKEHLNIHQSIHSGDKNQICPLCHRSFYRKDHLQKHLQTHNKIFIENNLIPMSDQELMEIKQEVMDEVDVKPVINADGSCEAIEPEIEINDSPLQSNDDYDADRPHSCPICYKTYKRKDHLKIHSWTHKEKDKICSECGKAFHKEEQLLTHMNLHLQPSRSHEGEAEEMPVQDLLVEHTEIDILPLESPLLVPRLHYKPGGQSSYKYEYRPHECPICHRKFKRKQHLKVHANVHLKQQQPTIWCSLCNEGFRSNEQFETHQCTGSKLAEDGEYEDEPVGNGTQDAKKENNYPMEFVDVVENQEAYTDELPMMIVNEEEHLPIPQRVYVCKFCSKPFKRKDHYKIHLHIHTGVKSFFCPDCGKGFYRKDHLQKHSTIHQKGKSKPKKELPDLFPINMLQKKEIKPEITITAPSNSKLRVPLQIKVPYQMVMSMDNGEQRAVNIDPQAGNVHQVLS